MKYRIPRKILAHLIIIVSGMFVVFYFIDRVNEAMAFIDNDISKALLLVLSMLGIAQSVLSLADARGEERALRESARKLKRRRQGLP